MIASGNVQLLRDDVQVNGSESVAQIYVQTRLAIVFLKSFES